MTHFSVLVQFAAGEIDEDSYIQQAIEQKMEPYYEGKGNTSGYIDGFMVEPTTDLFPITEDAHSRNEAERKELLEYMLPYELPTPLIHIGDIDHESMGKQQINKIDNWWKHYKSVMDGKEEDSILFGIDYDLEMMGHKSGIITRELLFNEYAGYFKDSTWAVIDTDGIWHSKNKMGWCAIPEGNNNEYLLWDQQYEGRFLSGDPDIVLMHARCHV